MDPLGSFSVDTTAPHAAQRFVGGDAYDALASNGRRRPPKARTMSEDDALDARKRQKMTATARDMVRNFVIARWAVNKHLDYVTDFNFRATTPDRGFNKALQEFLERKSRRENFDLARRHSRRRMLRITEARAVVDGDCGWIKNAPRVGSRNRGKVAILEGDRIYLGSGDRKKAPGDPDHWVNGVYVDPSTGEARGYAISDRQSRSSRLTFNRAIPARSVILRAYYERGDQVRGISPLASAINSYRDVYEGVDYALAKIKIAQLFGLKITRSGDGPLHDATAPTEDRDGDGEEDSSYEVNLGKGPFQLDLDPGDDADFMESGTPAAETTAFLKLAILVALKALDIPFSFFDESFTNFFGSKGSLLNYLRSSRWKIADNQEHLDAWTAWVLGLAIADGEFELPRGKDFSFLRWEWVWRGVPWWDPAKEVKGHRAAIAAGLDNPQRVCRETDTDFYDNVDKIADALEYARNAGVELNFGEGSGPDLELLAQQAAEEAAADGD